MLPAAALEPAHINAFSDLYLLGLGYLHFKLPGMPSQELPHSHPLYKVFPFIPASFPKYCGYCQQNTLPQSKAHAGVVCHRPAG